MIQNLFTYPGNFGKLEIYKCDYFGNSLSQKRMCYVDDFTVDVEQKNTADTMLFADHVQTGNFSIKARKIKLNTTILFSDNMPGTLDPGLDLLMNVSAYSYQGTTASYKFSLSSVSGGSLTYRESLPMMALNASNNISMFKFYLVNETNFVRIFPSSINTSTFVINYPPVTVPFGCWLEMFQYGNTTSSTAFPLYQEPMFRIDSSEGSFYPCMLDKMEMKIGDDFVRSICQIVCLNYDRSTRFDFINTTSVVNSQLPTRFLHRARVAVRDYTNDVTSNFLVTDLQNLDYTQGMLTQRLSVTPIEEITFIVENNLEPIYSNFNHKLKRFYVRGYISKQRNVYGHMQALALRSSQPTIERYPSLSSSGLNILFGNQIISIPYTIWAPGKVEVKQNEFTRISFDWSAIARRSEDAPAFTIYGADGIGN